MRRIQTRTTAHGAQVLPKNCTRRESLSPSSRLIRDFRNVSIYLWSSHTSRVRINRVRSPIVLARGQQNGEKNIFLSPFGPENLVSRDRFFGSPVPRQPAHLHTQDEYGAFVRDPSRFTRRRLFAYLKHHTPSGQSRVYWVTQYSVPMALTAERPPTQPVDFLGRSP